MTKKIADAYVSLTPVLESIEGNVATVAVNDKNGVKLGEVDVEVSPALPDKNGVKLGEVDVEVSPALPEGYTLLTGGTIVDADGNEHKLAKGSKAAFQLTEGNKTFAVVFNTESEIDNTKIVEMMCMIEKMKRESQN